MSVNPKWFYIVSYIYIPFACKINNVKNPYEIRKYLTKVGLTLKIKTFLCCLHSSSEEKNNKDTHPSTYN